MIVAERKPFDEIKEMMKSFKKVFVEVVHRFAFPVVKRKLDS